MKMFSKILRKSLALPISLGLLLVIGCGDGQKTGPDSINPPTEEVHNHPSEGPHHGSLIELGNEAYHGEFVHDEATGTVTIYLLDSTAKNAVPIEADSLLVNVSHDGQAKQYSLAATADTGDLAGKYSRFTSSDKELAEQLDLEDTTAQLVIEINGKQYRGEIHHDHDHENRDDHDH